MRTMQARRDAAWRAAMLAVLTGGTGLVLSGCGGSPFEDSPKDMYALSQSSVSCDAAPATTCADVKLYATPINGLTTDYRPGWEERPAVANNKAVDHVYRDLQADGRWLVSVGFTTGLKAGTYSGTIAFGQDPLSNALPPGERRSVSFSYRLTVTADSVARPLQAVSGAVDWAGPGGTPSRNGFIAVTVDPSKIQPRWSRTFLSQNYPAANVLLSQGQVVLPGLRLEDGTATDTVTVLSETDGQRVWSAALPGTPNRALASGDRLLIAGAASNDGKTSAISTVARADGAVRAQQSVDTIDMGDTWALSGDTLITPDLNGLTLSARGLDSLGTVRWTAQAYNPPLNLAGLVRWGVTVGNGRVHVNAGDRLRAFALSDGARNVDIVTPGKSPVVLFSTPLNQHPVLLDASTATVITNRDLRPGEGRDNQWSVVDLAGGQTRWTQSGRYMDLPVGNNGVVYASNQENKTIEARSVADGSLLWSWPMDAGDSYFQRQMVLTNQHLFVSTDRQTLAIDLGTHQAVWRYGAGGALAMSANGTLTLMVERSALSNRPMLVTFDVR